MGQEQFEQIIKFAEYPEYPNSTKYLPDLGILLFDSTAFITNGVSFTAAPIKVTRRFNKLEITLEDKSEIILPYIARGWFKFDLNISFESHNKGTYYEGYKDYHSIDYRINGICYDHFFNEWPKHNLKLDPTQPYSKMGIWKVTNISGFTFFAQSMIGLHYIEKTITPEEFGERYHVVCTRGEKEYYLVSETEYYKLVSVKLSDFNHKFTIGDINLRLCSTHGVVDSDIMPEPEPKKLTEEESDKEWKDLLLFYSVYLPLVGLDKLKFSDES